MARKRKTRTSEAFHQPELVQTLEPEPESETDQSDPVEALEEEPEVEEEEQEEEQTDNVSDEPKNGTVSEDLENKPSDNAVLQANGEGKNDEEELEEDTLEKLLEPFSKDQLTLLIEEAVAKHSDILENVQKLADANPMHRKIFVHGLWWDANDEIIKSVFGEYGEIEDCKVVSDKNSGKSKGYGFILYKHRDGARRALKQPQKSIGSRTTSCQLASTGPVQAPSSLATVSDPPVSEYTQRKIYVSNVSAEIDIKKLVEFFSKFGEIEEGPLGLDKQTGKPRGFCLFVYKNLESARKALEEPHKNFDGQILHCQKAIDGPKPTKGYYNQQHQLKQHHQGQQGYYHPSSKKGKYAGSSGVGHTGGHLMAPSAGPAMHSMGLNPAVAPAALGQVVAALLASQGAGLGIGNLLGGIGSGGNQQGVPPTMSNVGYRAQGGVSGYGTGSLPGMQGGYVPGGTRPQQGGASYMGHGP